MKDEFANLQNIVSTNLSENKKVKSKAFWNKGAILEYHQRHKKGKLQFLSSEKCILCGRYLLSKEIHFSQKEVFGIHTEEEIISFFKIDFQHSRKANCDSLHYMIYSL